MNRIAVYMLEFAGNTLWGFRPNLMKDIVEVQGAWKSLVWFVTKMPGYEKILKEWGAERVHLLAVAISSISGCPYCTYGHALSFQLHYFNNNKILFPIDEFEMKDFNSKSQQQIVETLNSLCDENNLVQQKIDLERFLQLKEDPKDAKEKHDYQIIHLIELFAVLNTCGIKGGTIPDQAHSPINKNVELFKTYRRAREESVT